MQLIISDSEEVKSKPTVNTKLCVTEEVDTSIRGFLLAQSIFLSNLQHFFGKQWVQQEMSLFKDEEWQLFRSIWHYKNQKIWI